MSHFNLQHDANLSPNRATGMARTQSGFSLIELMVAVVIGLFVVLGLSEIFLNMYTTSKSQNNLASFQDNERLALAMLVNTVQSAGYFPPLSGYSAATALPAYTNTGDGSAFYNNSGTTPTESPGITGNGAGTGTGSSSDSLDVYFMTNGFDGMMDCQGQTATPSGTIGNPSSWTYTLKVSSFSIDSNNNLICNVQIGTVSGTPPANTPTWTASSLNPLVLATGVQSMSILYGVDIAGNSGGVTSYLSATGGTGSIHAGTTSLWNNVRSVQVTINFFQADVFNTSSNAATWYQSGTTQWVQTINLMGKI